MKKEFSVGVGILVVSAALMALWRSPVPILDVLTYPISSLLGTQEQLETGVSDVVTHLDPVEAATRRLIQPFGTVRLTRRFSGPSASSGTHTNP